MEFDTITIDTQVVQSNSFDFDGGLLAQLKQFKDGPIQVVITTVVASEILKHLRESTLAAKEAEENAHRRAVLFGLKPKEEKVFELEPDVHDLTRLRVRRWLEEIGAKLVSADSVSTRDLMNNYFASKPPFSNTSKKKFEFPDAVAIMALENWAKDNNANILAVSGDGDWLSYQGNRVVPIKGLTEALAKLQTDATKAQTVVSLILNEIAEDKRPVLLEELEQELVDALPNFVVTGEADGPLTMVDEGVSLELNYAVVQGDESFSLVQIGPKKMVVSTNVLVNVNADATFSMYAYDGIDKDMVSMGSTSASRKDVELEIPVLITLEGDFAKGAIDISEVEIISNYTSINFGYIEPDFRDEPFDYDDSDQDDSVREGEVAADDGEPF